MEPVDIVQRFVRIKPPVGSDNDPFVIAKCKNACKFTTIRRIPYLDSRSAESSKEHLAARAKGRRIFEDRSVRLSEQLVQKLSGSCPPYIDKVLIYADKYARVGREY